MSALRSPATRARSRSVPGRPSLILGAALLSLSAPLLSAQTTVTFVNGETKSASLSTTGGLTLSIAAGTGTQSGTISGSGTLNIAGAAGGVIALTGANSHTGGTTLSSGTLAVGNDAALGSGSLTFAGGYSTLRGSGLRSLANDMALDAGSTANIDGSFGLTLSGSISGGADTSLILSGDTTLSGNNQNFSGLVTVGHGIAYDGSRLTVTHDHALGSGSSASVEIGSTLALDNVSVGAIPLALSGTGLNGAGALLGVGNSAYAGTISLLQNTPTIGVSAGGTLTLSGVVSSPFDTQILTKTGDGTLVLSGNNTYVGPTVVKAGTLTVVHSNALGTSYTGTTVDAGATIELRGGVTVSDQRLSLQGSGAGGNGALRNLGGNNTWNSEITITAATRVQSDAGLLTLAGPLTVTGIGQNLEAGGEGDIYFAGTVGGIALTKFGSGALTISGTHSLRGALAILGGTLRLGEGGALDNFGGITQIVNDGVLSLDTSSDFRVEDVISGAGVLEHRGSGKLTLTEANTYSGGTVLKSGQLEYYYATGLGTGAVTLDGGELMLHSSGLSNSLLIGEAGGSLNAYTATSLSASSISDAGPDAGVLVKTGSGTLTLTGTNAHTGGLRIAQGLVNFSSLAALGGGGLNLDGGGLQWAVGNTLDITSASQLGLVIGPGGAIFDTNGNNLVFEGSLTGTGGFTKSGAGLLTLATANALSGAVNVTAGTLRVVHAQALQSSSGINLGINGALQFAGDIGTVFGTNVTGPATSNFDIVSDRLTAGAGVTHSLGNLTIDARRLTVAKGANVTSGTAGLSFDSVTVTGDATFRAHASGTYLELGSVTASGGARNIEFSGSSGSVLVKGPIALGAGSVTKSSNSTLTLSGANTFTGGLTVSAGTLRATTSAAALGAGALTLSGGALQLANDTGLAFGRNTTVSAATTITSDRLTSGAGVTHSLGTLSIGAQTLSIARGANVSSGSAGIAFGDVGATGNATFSVASGARLSLGGISGSNRNLAFSSIGDTEVSGAIATGTGTLSKSGAGSLTLSGANTYAGATTVSAGSLFVNGSLSNSAITVANGATLGGTGTFARLATIQSGARLSAGVTTGTLTFSGGLTLNTGAILDFQLGSASDLIRVSGGSLTGSSGTGGVTIDLADSGGFVEGTYTLVDFTGVTALSGFDLGDFTLGNKIAGYDYTLGFANSALVLTATAIPEPGTLSALVGIAALGMVVCRRRRK